MNQIVINPYAFSAAGFPYDGSGLFTSGANLHQTLAGDGSKTTFSIVTLVLFTKQNQYIVIPWNGLGGGSVKQFGLYITSTGAVQAYNQTGAALDWQVTTNTILKDVGWYLIQLDVDTTQATAADRVGIKINNVVQTFASSSYPSLNFANYWNDSTIPQHIGNYPGAGSDFVGHMALFASSDGVNINSVEVATTVGSLLRLEDPTGITLGSGYGANLVIGQDIATGTATTGTNWTKTGTITATAMAPTDSATASRFATPSPLDKHANIVLANGNNQVSISGGANWMGVRAGIWIDAADDYHWQVTVTGTNVGAGYLAIGVANNTAPLTATSGTGMTGAYLYADTSTGEKYVNGTVSAYGSDPANGDVLDFYLTAGVLTVYKNDVSMGTLASGLSGKFTPIVYIGAGGNDVVTFNFGATTYTYTVKGSSVDISTYNLPAGMTVTSGTGDQDTFINTGGSLTSVTWSGTTYTKGVHDGSVIRFYASGFKALSGGTGVSWSAVIEQDLATGTVTQVKGSLYG